MIRIFRSALVWFTLVFIWSCATEPQQPTPRQGRQAPSPELPTGTAAEAKAFKDVYSLYNAQAFSQALQKLTDFRKRYPKSQLTPQVENLRGLVYVVLKQPLQAIGAFKKSIVMATANPSFIQYVRYNLATAQFEADLIEDAAATLNETHLEYLDRDNLLKVYFLKSKIDEKRNLPYEAARDVLEGAKLMNAQQAKDARTNHDIFSTQIGASLQQLGDPEQLEKLSAEFPDSAFLDLILFRLGETEMARGNAGKGETYLHDLMTRFPDSPFYSQALDLLNASQSQSVVDSHAVGVLLPMSGKFAKFGQRNLQAIELAFHIFNPGEPDTKIRLIIADSGDDPDQAVKALTHLVMKSHVVAVIGPLLSKGIDQITQRAQELGVPLLSLSRRTGGSGDYIFQAGLTPKLQAHEIAKYAIDRLGYKRFAIMYPRDKGGDEMSGYFWDEVEAQGGKIAGAESYAPGETDFRQPVDKLSGLYYTEARQKELDDLAKSRELNHIRKRTRKTEQYFSLKPIVDYDAVFIPDEPKVSGQIIPTFAYRDVDKVKFLGTSQWDSPEFPSRVLGYAESTFFVDAFTPDNTSDAVKKFTNQYSASFGNPPTALEALAYDAGAILEHALSSSSPDVKRLELRDQLKAIHGFQSVTGKISYSDGQFSRDLKVLTIHGGKIAEATN